MTIKEPALLGKYPLPHNRVDGEIEEYIYIIRDISSRIVLENKMEKNISA